jgi:hypothetical protein
MACPAPLVASRRTPRLPLEVAVAALLSFLLAAAEVAGTCLLAAAVEARVGPLVAVAEVDHPWAVVERVATRLLVLVAVMEAMPMRQRR